MSSIGSSIWTLGPWLGADILASEEASLGTGFGGYGLTPLPALTLCLMFVIEDVICQLSAMVVCCHDSSATVDSPLEP